MMFPPIRNSRTSRPRSCTLSIPLAESPDLVELISRAIVDDPPLAIKEGGMIRNGFDTALDELRTAQRGGKDWIAKLQADKSRAREFLRSRSGSIQSSAITSKSPGQIWTGRRHSPGIQLRPVLQRNPQIRRRPAGFNAEETRLRNAHHGHRHAIDVDCLANDPGSR